MAQPFSFPVAVIEHACAIDGNIVYYYVYYYCLLLLCWDIFPFGTVNIYKMCFITSKDKQLESQGLCKFQLFTDRNLVFSNNQISVPLVLLFLHSHAFVSIFQIEFYTVPILAGFTRKIVSNIKNLGNNNFKIVLLHFG